MGTEIQCSKLALRRRVRDELQAMTEAQREGASARACALLMAQPLWREAKTVLFFAPLPEELDVWPLLGEALGSGKRVFLPRFVGGKPLKRFGDAEAPPNTQLKQGVNETVAAPGTQLKQGGRKAEVRGLRGEAEEEVRGQKSEVGSHGITNQPGSYVVCEIIDPDKHIRLGQFGIREPVENCAELTLNRLDLILVPGVAFDLHGRRLGRGRGFYDRLLAVVRGTTCGAAFDQQIVGEIPVEPHDVHLNCILTPTRWIAL